MPRRTKIVCTLGPAVDSKDQIKALIAAGMNVARLNCSHGDWDTKRRWIEWVRQSCKDIAPVAKRCAVIAETAAIGESTIA